MKGPSSLPHFLTRDYPKREWTYQSILWVLIYGQIYKQKDNSSRYDQWRGVHNGECLKKLNPVIPGIPVTPSVDSGFSKGVMSKNMFGCMDRLILSFTRITAHIIRIKQEQLHNQHKRRNEHE